MTTRRMFIGGALAVAASAAVPGYTWPNYYFTQFLEDMKSPERRAQLYRIAFRYKQRLASLQEGEPIELTREEYMSSTAQLADMFYRASGFNPDGLRTKIFSTEEELKRILRGTEYDDPGLLEPMKKFKAFFVPPNIAVVRGEGLYDVLFPNAYAHEGGHFAIHMNCVKSRFTRLMQHTQYYDQGMIDVFEQAIDEGMAQCFQEDTMKLFYEETGDPRPLRMAYEMILEDLACAVDHATGNEMPACICTRDNEGNRYSDLIDQYIFGSAVMKLLQDKHGHYVWKEVMHKPELLLDF